MSIRERVTEFFSRSKLNVESPQEEIIPCNPLVTVDVTERTFDLLRAGATQQQRYEDLLKLVYIQRAVVRVKDINNTTKGGVEVTELPKRTS